MMTKGNCKAWQSVYTSTSQFCILSLLSESCFLEEQDINLIMFCLQKEEQRDEPKPEGGLLLQGVNYSSKKNIMCNQMFC